MPLQCILGPESLSAVSAHIVLLRTQVDVSDVRLHPGLGHKALVAHRAQVLLVIGMQHQMLLEHFPPAKDLFPADAALERTVVNV